MGRYTAPPKATNAMASPAGLEATNLWRRNRTVSADRRTSKFSGGANAEGDAPGAAGVAQCFELFQQARVDAVNQFDGARIGPEHRFGGPTAVAAVTVLEGTQR